MTFKEKLERNRGCLKEPAIIGKAYGCPYDYGYEGHDDGLCRGTWVGGEGVCRACWDREIPMTPEEQEKHDLEINAENIGRYCSKFICSECPAGDVCRNEPGLWSNGSNASAKKQRAMLDAFGETLSVENDAPAEAETKELPQAVRELVEAQIKELTEQVKALEAERDTLCDYLLGANNGDKIGGNWLWN